MKSAKQSPKRNAERSVLPAVPKRSAPARRRSSVIDLVPAVIKLKSILVPIDFSEPSKKCLEYARQFARQFGAKLTVVSVIEPLVSADFASFPLALGSDEAERSVKNKLDQLCQRHRLNAALLEKTLVRVGQPFYEICRAATTLKADLIVIATHGYTGLKRAWLGSTAERVVRYAPCPVLVVRERGQGVGSRKI